MDAVTQRGDSQLPLRPWQMSEWGRDRAWQPALLEGDVSTQGTEGNSGAVNPIPDVAPFKEPGSVPATTGTWCPLGERGK